MATGKKRDSDERRMQVPVRVPVSWQRRLHRIIYHTGKGRSVQSLLEAAFLQMLERIEKEENGGKPFPPIPDEDK